MRTVRRTVPVALSCAVAGLLAGGCGQEAPDAQPTEDSEESMESVESAPEAPAAESPEPSPVTPLERGVAFLEENGRRANVVTTPSGLQYEVLESGTGATPGATDYVTAHYHGTLIDGRVFDSSVQRGQPNEFPVNGVIGGWTEALQLMQVGDKWRLYIPPALAYGKRGAGPTIGPDETLIFEVELISVRKT